MNDTTPIDEGYVKYESDWTAGPAPDDAIVLRLDRWRRRLFDAGLIGYYEEHDVGFGNISVRVDSTRFVISGTQTGHIAETDGQHYALVTEVDIDANRLRCTGPVQASSEAMTHAALYALDGALTAVVHVHSERLWRENLDRLPTTSADIAYGTPQMAYEFRRLWRETDFPETRISVMAGHEEGIVSVGESLREASERVLSL